MLRLHWSALLSDDLLSQEIDFYAFGNVFQSFLDSHFRYFAKRIIVILGVERCNNAQETVSHEKRIYSTIPYETIPPVHIQNF